MDLSALYRAAVDTSPDGIWVLDLHGRILYANPEVARIHGIPEEQLTSLTVPDILDADGRHQFAAHLAAVRTGEQTPGPVEVQWVRSDGSVVWMLVSETVMHDEDGAASALVHRFTDHSEQRAIRESLQASEDALQDQIAQNTLMQAVTSAANRASTLDEVLAQARDLVLVHDDWERARAFVPRDGILVPFVPSVDTDSEVDPDDLDGSIAAAELRLARRCFTTGEVVWDDRRLTVVFPVAVDETVHAVVAITSAPPLWRFELIETMAARVGEQLARVAQREQADRELARARDQAMEASRHKSEFLATMSHEIRSPLNGVIGLNELLLKSDLDPEQHRLASGAQVASRALLDVINDILDFSKIEAGRLELEQVDFAVRPLLDQVAGMLAQPARDKGLDLTLACDPDVATSVTGDPTRLAQLVTNLVSNAVKFTQRGRVAVSMRISPDTGHLRLEVCDTGIGVPPDRVPGLFDPFTQADTSTTRRYGGTGLGLAICRAIVVAMHGEIGYLANSSGGSIFWADLPLAPVEAQAPGGDLRTSAAPDDADADHAARQVLGGRQVLLIDSRDGQVLRDQLGYWGVGIEEVTSVRSALARLSSPDAAVVDAVVIALAGAEWRALELADRMRAGAAADIPLLVVASAVPADRELLEAAGVTDVLQRPVVPSLLRTTMVRLMTGDVDTSDTEAVRSTAGSGASRGRILVVEDHPINQMVAEGLLGALGYDCTIVGDGLAAVEAARDGAFDAVLTDVQMPLLDGYEATRRIRIAEADGPRIPIIAMTAAAVEGERERCLDAGMDDFLTKPISGQALGECLGRWVHQLVGEPTADEPAVREPVHDVVHDTVLDEHRLAELRELDTPTASYVERAVGNFLTNSVRDVDAMRNAHAQGDLTALAAVAHRLAGGALNLGAVRAGETLRTIDSQVRAGADADTVAPLLTTAELELDLGCAALRAYLAQIAPGGTSATQVAVDPGADQAEDHPDDSAPGERLEHQQAGV